MNPVLHRGSPAWVSSRRLPVRATEKPVNFICFAAQAKSVYLAGDFNDWNPASHLMKKSFDGSWQLAVALGHGGHNYQFIIDGQPVNDPRAQGLVRNEKGDKVSMILVS